MAKFRVQEIVIYEVEAESCDDAIDQIVNSDDPKVFFHSVEDRTAYQHEFDF